MSEKNTQKITKKTTKKTATKKTAAKKTEAKKEEKKTTKPENKKVCKWTKTKNGKTCLTGCGAEYPIGLMVESNCIHCGRGII